MARNIVILPTGDSHVRHRCKTNLLTHCAQGSISKGSKGSYLALKI